MFVTYENINSSFEKHKDFIAHLSLSSDYLTLFDIKQLQFVRKTN